MEYYPDVIWQQSVAAEAANHWPLQVPDVAGAPLQYHYFAFMHMAASHESTGIDLSLINLRLNPMPLLLLLIVQFVVVGRILDRRSSTGLLAVGLAFLVYCTVPGIELQPAPFQDLFLSASYLYGYVFFLPAVGLLLTLVSDSKPLRAGPCLWVLLFLFLAAAMGAKGSILPVVGAGLAILFGYLLAYRRELLPHIFAALLLVGFVFLLAQGLIYRGNTAGGTFDLFGTLRDNPTPFDALLGKFPSSLPINLYWAIASVPATVLITVPISLGIALLYAIARRLPDVKEALLLALFLASLGFLYAVSQSGESQLYFFFYGYGAAALVAARGWRETAERLTAVPRAALVAAAVAIAVAFGLVGDDPVIRAPKTLARYVAGKATWNTAPAVTPALTEALYWMRDHTSINDVFAVNNQYEPDRVIARACYYTALSERRAMLGCEYDGRGTIVLPLHTVRQDPSLHPYARRFKINEHAFRGNPKAIRQAATSGVTYLFLDKQYAPAHAEARLRRSPVLVEVFANSAAAIYRVES